MALEGRIKDFGVADIIQLVSQQQKSGILCVEKTGVRAEISFLGGNITAAKPSEYKTSQPLGEMMVASGRLSEKNLKKALAEQQKTFEYLGQILVREGLVAAADIERALMTQIYETAYDILQWRDGTYRFEPKEIQPDPNLPNAVPVESMLLDVLRMIDEWPDVQAEMPEGHTVFHRVSGSTADGLDEHHAFYYQLVNGKRTLQQIIDTSLCGKFDACKALIELMRNGCVEGAVPEKAAEGGGFGAEQIWQSMVYGAAVLMVCSAVIMPFVFPINPLPLLTPAMFRESVLQDYLDNGKRVKVEKALEVFRVRQGPYPEKLSELVLAGLLKNKDLMLSGNRPLEYVRLGNAYRLLPATSPE